MLFLYDDGIIIFSTNKPKQELSKTNKKRTLVFEDETPHTNEGD